MLKIDDALLQELGLGDLPLEEKDLLLTQIFEELELRVGTRLADNMSEAQLKEFDTNFIQKDDQEGAMKWLQTNFPNYPEVVKEELQKLKDELKQQSSTIKNVVQTDQKPPQAPAQNS